MSARKYEELIRDALHQRRVNEHVDKPDPVFKVWPCEYLRICMAEYSDPFVSKRSELTGKPEEFCGLKLVQEKS